MEKELLVLTATALPREKLVEMIEESVSEFKEATLLGKTDEELESIEQKLAVVCHMFTINLMTKGSIPEAVRHMKRMDEIDARDKLFQVKEN